MFQKLIAARYDLVQRLGHGSFGSTFIVQDKEDLRHYVLKRVTCRNQDDVYAAMKEVYISPESGNQFRLVPRSIKILDLAVVRFADLALADANPEATEASLYCLVQELLAGRPRYFYCDGVRD